MPRTGEKHTPMRMCIACRDRFPKEALTRYVRPEHAGDAALEPVPDPEQITPGRGYYVCGQARCRERFPKMVMGLMKKRER